MPQSVNVAGGFRATGRTGDEAAKVTADAHAVADAGAFAVVVEGTLEPVAAAITAEIAIPTIGIGASAQCDGQVLVIDDVLGTFNDFIPRFVKRYAELGVEISRAAWGCMRRMFGRGGFRGMGTFFGRQGKRSPGLCAGQAGPSRESVLRTTAPNRVNSAGLPWPTLLDFDRFSERPGARDGAGFCRAASRMQAQPLDVYIFPQLAGLGRSSTAQYYALASLDEARRYLAHPTLYAADCMYGTGQSR